MVGTLLRARLTSLYNARVFALTSRSQSLYYGAHGRSSISVAERLQGHWEVTLSRSKFNGIRTYCTGTDLTTKKCVPCSSEDLRPMTQEAANQLIAKVPEWDLVNEDGIMKLHRSWKVKTFMKGLQFFQLVANLAEAEGHHPDLHLVGWNNVKIDIWTHAVGGLTENDFILAAKISGLDLHHLLSRKANDK
ncbi:hypothetical protein M9H77_11147 [Catharanthus roseus]|uniref:Uncharacterized protein n=1 Tax=Catharanthus roseus TaxID=4058 RepID=A0ACC0BDS9_CATRO|nr:hypothetical protein M9H77_11147 [Catharanthus roseus]